MNRTVLIVGPRAPYMEDTSGMDVWGVNLAYKWMNLDRLYFMDGIQIPRKNISIKDFIKEVNALDIPIVTKCHYPEIPKSEGFDLMAANQLAGNRLYFTSSVCYMVADAILKGYRRIILHKFNEFPMSPDYFVQKSCLDFWCGIAIGRGIDVAINEESQLCRAYPWISDYYGFVRTEGEAAANIILSGAVREIIRMMSESSTKEMFETNLMENSAAEAVAVAED